MVKVACCGTCFPPEDEQLLHPGKLSSDGARSRRCTDCLCLMLFMLILIPGGIIATAAFQVGDMRRLTSGEDYTGALCGVGDLAGRPYVFYPRLALDLLRFRSLLSAAPWAVPLYGVCVAACPSQGDGVLDYACDEGNAKCRWRPTAVGAPSWAREQPNEWRVSMDTVAVASRCLPITRASESVVHLCAYPDCVAAHRPCYTDAFADEYYWQVSESAVRAGRQLQESPEAAEPATVVEVSPPPPMQVANEAQCLEFVTVDTRRTITSKSAALELEFISSLFGGALGVATDLYLGWFEICVCGVLMALVANALVLLVLRHFIRLLFYTTVLLGVIALGLVDAIAFAKAGLLKVPSLTQQAFGHFQGLSVGGISLELPAAAHSAATTLASSTVFEQATLSSQTHWLLGAGAAVLLTLGVLLALCMLWPKVETSLEICRTASKAVNDNPGLLVLPLLSTTLSLGVLAYFGLVSAYILTPDPETIAAQIDGVADELARRSVSLSSQAAHAVRDATHAAITNVNQLAQDQLHAEDTLLDFDVGEIDVSFNGAAAAFAFNLTEALAPSSVAATALAYQLLCCLWLLFFIDGLIYCVIAGTIACWYEQRTEGTGMLSALGRQLRYHLGSVALGAGVLAAFSWLRAAMLYVQRQAAAPHSAAATPLTRYLLGCCACCLWCFDHCLRYLTKFAYVHVAADGVPFCTAAVRTFGLLSAHPLQLMTNEAALAILALLLSLLTPLSCALLAYFAVLRQWRSGLMHANVDVPDAPAALSNWTLGLASPSLVGNASASIDAFVDRVVDAFSTSLPDWDASGPPSALNVALACLALSFCVTQMFRRVLAATVDTLYVVCFFVEDEDAMLRGRGRGP